MPVTIKAYTMHCNDDTYTIVLNSRHSLEQLMKAYHHEMKHIENGDYDKQCKDVQVVEIFAQKNRGIFIMNTKQKWYLSTWFIALLCACWFLIIPPIIGIILLIIKAVNDKKQKELFTQTFNQNNQLSQEYSEMKQTCDELGVTEYIETKKKIEQIEQESAAKITSAESEAKANLDSLNEEIQSNNVLIDKLRTEINELQQQDDKLKKSLATQQRKISRSKELYKSFAYAFDNFINLEIPYNSCILSTSDLEDAEEIAPSVILKLHCMDIKSLRKAYKDNEKLIDNLLKQYSARYTTKANKAIYNLMVIALRAELQNVLYALKYEKLDTAIEHVKDISAKYLKIAGEGNQTIAGTLTKFIGELEYLFINAVKIEYNYYVKREQAKQEQMALKEQMRQEAEERKALEREKKHIQQEEEKFNTEISKLQDTMLNTTDESEIDKLKARILELQSQLGEVIVKKDEITNLQNGKAGTVYIISNLGAFGEDVFKVGMTRRLEPQDRINELGNASVPFKFDVHSFIFSKDAVALENKMHEILNDRRVNKVNMRKEFFKISIDELEKIVDDIRQLPLFC